MSYVFFSYSHKDTDDAGKIINALRAGGFTVWQDTSDIRGGDLWISKIQSGIADASVVVVLWSAHSQPSDWVKREIQLAIVQGKKIFALRLDQTPLPAELTLTQAIPFTPNFERGKTQLIADLPQDIRRRQLGFELGKPLSVQNASKKLPIEDGSELLWIPLIQSGYCQAHVVGLPQTTIRVPEALQVCLQFSREAKFAFVPDVYRWFRHIHQDNPTAEFVAVCVTSPVNADRKHYLDNDNVAQWFDAIDTTYEAIGIFSEARRPILQIFNLAPASLMAGLGLKFYRFWHLQMYNLDGKSYKRVLEILPDGQSS